MTWNSRLIEAVALAAALSACKNDNPDYNAAEGSGETDASTTTPTTGTDSDSMTGTDPTDSTTNSTTDTDPTDSTTDTDPTDSTTDTDPTDSTTDTDPTDTDPTDTDPTDTDPTDTDPTDTDPTTDPPEDLPSACLVSTEQPLYPYFGNTELFDGCDDQVEEQWVKRIGSEGGDWIVHLCENGCLTCDDGPGALEIPLGAPGLKINELIASALPDDNNAAAGCFFVEFLDLLEPSAEGCLYGSMAVFEPYDELGYAPRLVATREGYTAPPVADFSLDFFEPTISDAVETCVCEEAWEGYCCEGDGVQTFAYFDDVLPGQSTELFLTPDELSYQFLAVQAQTAVNCEPFDEFSWALVRP